MGGPRTRTIRTDWKLLSGNVASPGDNGFTPATGFIASGGVSRARVTFETRNRIGAIEILGAVNFANDDLAPDASYTGLGSTWVSSNGVALPADYTDVSSDAWAAQQMRFGWVSRNTSGTTPSSVEVRGAFEYDVFELSRYDVAATLLYADSTTERFFPCSPWFDAVTLPQARATFEVLELNGNLAIGFAVQPANDPDSPGPPAELTGLLTSTGWHYPTTFHTVTGGAQLQRFGWITKLTSPSATAFATARGCCEFGALTSY